VRVLVKIRGACICQSSWVAEAPWLHASIAAGWHAVQKLSNVVFGPALTEGSTSVISLACVLESVAHSFASDLGLAKCSVHIHATIAKLQV
jgi:hypothetical protein